MSEANSNNAVNNQNRIRWIGDEAAVRTSGSGSGSEGYQLYSTFHVYVDSLEFNVTRDELKTFTKNCQNIPSIHTHTHKDWNTRCKHSHKCTHTHTNIYTHNTDLQKKLLYSNTHYTVIHNYTREKERKKEWEKFWTMRI